MRPIEHLTEDTFEAAVKRPGLIVSTLAPSAKVGRVMRRDRRWPLERVLFALAGTMTLLSAVLAATVSRSFLLLTAFVAVNQWLYAFVGNCPASVVLRRACHLRSAIHQPPHRTARSREEVTV